MMWLRGDRVRKTLIRGRWNYEFSVVKPMERNVLNSLVRWKERGRKL